MNIPCPVCKGSAKAWDTDAGEESDQPCTACLGSGVMELTEDQMDRRERERDRRVYSRKDWTDGESDRLVTLLAEGFTQVRIAEILDRTRDSINGKQRYLGIKIRGRHD